MKRIVRRGLSSVVCGILAVTGLSVTAPAHAAVRSEAMVIPADQLATYQNDLLLFAGKTGFLHQRALSSPVLWTTYADRATRVVPELAGIGSGRMGPAGGDAVFLPFPAPGNPSSTSVSTFDLATMTWRQFDRPYTQAISVHGDYELLWPEFEPTTDVPELRRVAADGSTTDVPLSGLPEGATGYQVPAGDSSSMVLEFIGPDTIRYGLLDLASGRIAMIPGNAMGVRQVLLTDDRVGLLIKQTMYIYARTALRDGAAVEPVTVALPNLDELHTTLAGDDVIVASATNWTSEEPALRYSASDPTPTEVVPLAQGAWPNMLQGPDGVLLVGGTGPADWAVRRVTGTGQNAVLSLSGPLTNAGITLAQGELRHVEALALPGEAPAYHLYNHQIVAGTTGNGLTTQTEGGVLDQPLPCETGATCVRMIDGSGYGAFYLGAGSATTVRLNSRIDVHTSFVAQTLPSGGGTLVDVSAGYAVVRGTDPAAQYVAAPGHGTFTTGPVTGAGLWFDTLWTAPRPGYLQPKNLTTGQEGAAIATGSACQATEVQVALKYVYWSCGADGPVGVYDLTRAATVALPAARYLLGDGYVVRHDANGDLVRYDLARGTTAVLGTVARGPLADDRNIDWAVDKYSGDVAYVDEQDAVHVVDPGDAQSAPAAPGGPSANTDYIGFPSTTPWTASSLLTRPVDSWRLTVFRAGAGEAAATVSGGPTLKVIYASWDGMVAGKPALSGRYQYTITALAGGMRGTISSGIVNVSCGTPTFRSYDCDGRPSILGITKSPAGNGHWLTADVGGKSLQDGGYTEQWSVGSANWQVNAIVPVGDINGDRYGDILVRKGDGSLRAYLGFGQAYFGANKSLAIPGNFGHYDALVSTGDITGDGRVDMIARDHATGALYRFAGNGKGGFSGAAKLAGGYRGYSKIIGTGDITGDGKPDLLLLLGTYLYGLPGTGTGSFGDRFFIGAGYAGYNSIIGAGDINDDGYNDLVARDSSGNLWLLPGNGHNGFGARVKLGAGYQKYGYLY